jgi:hypothetical protein
MNREAKTVRSLTNKLDALKSATMELDEILMLAKASDLLSDTWANNTMLNWIDALVDETYERINEIVVHVVENGMLKEDS